MKTETNIEMSTKKQLEDFIDGNTKLKLIPKGKDKQQAWMEIESKIRNNERIIMPPADNRVINWYLYASIAASVLIIAGIFYVYIIASTITYKCDNGQIVNVFLPDSSEVQLNAGSEIKFKKYNWKKNRSLTLNGEAFFKVKKGKTFDVITSNGKVQVLGTSFNVYSRDTFFRVYCHTGKVKVQTFTAVLLQKGDACKKVGNTLVTLDNSNNSNQMTWINGELVFDNMPLNQVFNELERQYDVEIIYNDKELKNFTGSLTKTDIISSLNIISYAMQFEYKIEKNIVKIN